MAMQVNVTPSWRKSLPIDIRRRLGLIDGGPLLVEETQDGIVLRTVSQAVTRAQAISRALLEGNPDTSGDAFIAESRQWQE